jgi:predicted MFS family arabinose efflux permease
VLVDAASYLFSGLTLAALRVAEPKTTVDRGRGDLRREIAEGLRWVYGHRMLAPLAIGTHGWFLFNSVFNTVFTPFALVGLRLTPFELGIALAATGLMGLVGSALAAPIGRRWGAGTAVVGCHALTPLACAVVALAPARGDHTLVVAVLALGQGLYGLSLGAENANSLGYRQAVTPDALQGRMNTTMRSLNRAMIVIGAPLGGLVADRIGYRPTLWIAVAGFALVAAGLALSPFRQARHGDAWTQAAA